jgi:putative ABC transport system ATP-binding protein
MLRINALSKIYRRPDNTFIQALDNVSLSVDTGEFVTVEGPSGCGKTTLLLASGGLLKPSEGNVEIDGCDIYRLSFDKRASLRARNIGFVFQQFYLISYLNVLDNVLAPSLALPDSLAKKHALELIDRFRLTDRINHFPAELSTGERQRVGLARALLNRPGLLLADEPTGNLDPENSRIVLECFAGFAGDGGSVLMVTHSDTASSYARRTARLAAGKLSEVK